MWGNWEIHDPRVVSRHTKPGSCIMHIWLETENWVLVPRLLFWVFSTEQQFQATPELHGKKLKGWAAGDMLHQKHRCAQLYFYKGCAWVTDIVPQKWLSCTEESLRCWVATPLANDLLVEQGTQAGYRNSTHRFILLLFGISKRFKRRFRKSSCSTTGKPTRSFATERVSLDSV